MRRLRPNRSFFLFFLPFPHFKAAAPTPADGSGVNGVSDDVGFSLSHIATHGCFPSLCFGGGGYLQNTGGG